MKPWPGIRRGTECTVPIVPGFVMVAVVLAKSSGVMAPVRTLRIISSYAAKKPAKSNSSACFTLGTRSVREPSDLATSTARPRFTWSWRTTTGAPSAMP